MYSARKKTIFFQIKNWRPSRWRPSAARDAKTKQCTHYLFLARPDGCRLWTSFEFFVVMYYKYLKFFFLMMIIMFFCFWNGSSTSWVISTNIWIKTLSKFETVLFVKLCKIKGTISGVSILDTFKEALSTFEALVLVILWRMKGTAFELFSYNFITVEYSFSGNRSSSP